jgi:glucose/arabinose dehydrogenase
MHLIRRSIVWVVLTAALVAVVGVDAYRGLHSSPAVPNLPGAPKIFARTVMGGLNDPAGFTFDRSGKIYFLERGTGRVRTLDPVTKSLADIFTISGVDGSGERGALGIALSPGWPAVPYLYVYVTRQSSLGALLENQLVRIRVINGVGNDLQVLFSQPVSTATNHNGGRILFGPDGYLYVVIGENADSANSQDLTNLRGKILRVLADGTASDGSAAPGDIADRIYAYGIRNSFGFTFDPNTGRLWETDNGPECNDEINVIVAGGNYGWGPSESCGVVAQPSDTNNSGALPRIGPVLSFRRTIGITGAAFCHGCGLGAVSEGRLFFGAVNDGVLRSVALNADRISTSGPVAEALMVPAGIFSMEVGPDGALYFSNSAGIYRLALG